MAHGNQPRQFALIAAVLASSTLGACGKGREPAAAIDSSAARLDSAAGQVGEPESTGAMEAMPNMKAHMARHMTEMQDMSRQLSAMSVQVGAMERQLDESSKSSARVAAVQSEMPRMAARMNAMATEINGMLAEMRSMMKSEQGMTAPGMQQHLRPPTSRRMHSGG